MGYANSDVSHTCPQPIEYLVDLYFFSPKVIQRLLESTLVQISQVLGKYRARLNALCQTFGGDSLRTTIRLADRADMRADGRTHGQNRRDESNSLTLIDEQHLSFLFTDSFENFIARFPRCFFLLLLFRSRDLVSIVGEPPRGSKYSGGQLVCPATNELGSHIDSEKKIMGPYDAPAFSKARVFLSCRDEEKNFQQFKLSNRFHWNTEAAKHHCDLYMIALKCLCLPKTRSRQSFRCIHQRRR